MVTDVEFSSKPTSVDEFTASEIIPDCSVNSTLVSEFNGASLIDGQEYFIGVVAYDVYLNSQNTGVQIVNATPIDNLNGEIIPPGRITDIKVFDTPNDNGTSFDVIWSVSNSDDFGYYTVWVADRPLDNVMSLWEKYGTNQDTCGCVVFDQQSVDEERDEITLRLTSGLYSSTDASGEPINESGLIRANTMMYVAITVHDTNGDAYLTGLLSPSVTPINNFLDDIAPDRIDTISLQDRPLDDGSAVSLEFELSSASDIYEYQVFAAPFRFTSVGEGSDGPVAPVLVTDRSPNFPLSITQVAGGFNVNPQLMLWVAVVPVDFAGNAILTDLFTSSIQSIDNGFANDGSGLPSVEGLVVSWMNGDEILIEWNQTGTEFIKGYQVHISAEDFSEIANATLIGDDVSSARFVVTKENFDSLTNTTSWYLSVTPFDNENVKQSVQTVQLDANQAPPSENENEGELSIQTLLSTRNLFAAGVVLAVLLLLIAFSRSRKGRSDISNAWDAQASTWGMDEDSQMDGLLSPVPPMPQGFDPGSMAPINGEVRQQMPPVQPYYGQPQAAPPAYSPPVQPVQPQAVQPAYSPPVQPSQVQPSANIDVSFLDELL
jgi:hypothetical protein